VHSKLHHRTSWDPPAFHIFARSPNGFVLPAFPPVPLADGPHDEPDRACDEADRDGEDKQAENEVRQAEQLDRLAEGDQGVSRTALPCRPARTAPKDDLESNTWQRSRSGARAAALATSRPHYQSPWWPPGKPLQRLPRRRPSCLASRLATPADGALLGVREWDTIRAPRRPGRCLVMNALACDGSCGCSRMPSEVPWPTYRALGWHTWTGEGARAGSRRDLG
jgi:hypothetical protein